MWNVWYAAAVFSAVGDHVSIFFSVLNQREEPKFSVSPPQIYLFIYCLFSTKSSLGASNPHGSARQTVKAWRWSSSGLSLGQEGVSVGAFQRQKKKELVSTGVVSIWKIQQLFSRIWKVTVLQKLTMVYKNKRGSKKRAIKCKINQENR